MTEINRRISAGVEGEGLRPFARRLNLPIGVLRSVLDDRDISVSNLKLLSDAFGLELYVGPPISPDVKSRAAAAGTPLTDDNRLLQAITAVEEGFAKSRKRIQPRKKAEIIMAVYDLLGESDQGSDDKIIRLVSAM